MSHIQYICQQHSFPTSAKNIHFLHLPTTFIFYICQHHSFSASANNIHSLHLPTTFILCICQQHSFSASANNIHSLHQQHSFSTSANNIHTLHQQHSFYTSANDTDSLNLPTTLYCIVFMWCLCGARPALTPGATPILSTGNSASTGFLILCTSGPTVLDSIILSWPRFSPTSNTLHL